MKMNKELEETIHIRVLQKTIEDLREKYNIDRGDITKFLVKNIKEVKKELENE